MFYSWSNVLLTSIWIMWIPDSESKEYKLGFVTPLRQVRLGWDINAAAATMAIEQCEKDQLLNGNTIRLIYRDDGCNAKMAAGGSVDLRWKEDVDGFIGSPCSHAAEIVGNLASYWNLPLFSQSAADPALTDKSTFTTLVRMGAPFIRLGPAVGEMFSYFNWKQFVMLTRRTDNARNVFCDYSARAIEENFRNSDVKLADAVEFDEGLSAEQIDEILTRARQRGRIIVLCANIADEHHFLLRAHANQMTNGDFLFITFHYVPPSYIKTPWSYTSPYKDNPDLKILYKNVIQVSLASLSGPKTDTFLQEIPRKMTEAPWFYNGTLDSGKLGSMYSIFLYDVMYLYCLALNDTLQQGGDPKNGTQMFNNAKSRVFDGITGPVAMDDNADKLPNYGLWHMNKEGTSFEVWTEIDMIKPQGQRMAITSSSTWNTRDGSVPVDVPICGFTNQLCPTYDLRVILPSTLVCVTIAVIMAVTVTLIVRRQKYKSELQKMLWKIDNKDLCVVKTYRRFGSAASFNTTKSSYNLASEVTSTASGVDATGKCALLHGVTVSVHRITTSKPTLTNIETMELNVMRQMTHENLNQFIGMSLEPPDVCIVSAHCSRGTLQDILATDEIKLDAVFKKSLLHDLVSGVTYIHNSALKSHGHLTSDNCLIDNHWVLKVANFGVQNVRKSVSQLDNGLYQMYRDLLWTAPEVLRQTESDKEPNGSREGDVYSVGIIMQEVMFRCMPFGNDMDPKEIVEKIKEMQDPLFRPDLDYLSRDSDFNPESCDLELMTSCWCELPQQRPKMRHVKKLINQSHQGKSVIDNMLAIMEKYANNLEEIVDTRTAELVEEKKKTDVLLYSMLPKQVADKLKVGRMVEPEMFDAVTIFFSDIVGFTQLSSESTPMQIIHLLNDLYSLFDDIIKQYDVYKVETIGDAYMLVSGLPQPNGDKHASEIANTALDLLEAVSTVFKVRHKAGYKLLLRTGINTGPCAAGVVGLTMPRYCLFGDTVNTASRMESNGEALKIHISESCENILQSIGGYTMTERGEIEIKGKGKQRTYWLLGKEHS